MTNQLQEMERITWLDSGLHLGEEWIKLTVLPELAATTHMRVVTVGQLAFENEEVVVLGLSWDEHHGTVFGAQVIAKASILERELLVSHGLLEVSE